MPDDLLEQVAQFLNLYSTPSRPLRLGVAVSGGADSVSLLHILQRLHPGLVVIHVNHQLRGGESDEDEQFVQGLAESMGLAIDIYRGRPGKGNLEAEARRTRQEFFAASREKHKLDYVCTGHTASDQAETVLFRLLRGSGLRGLSGMAPASSGILRPLLNTSRSNVREYARAHNLAWREDKSNKDYDFRRNWLRFAILPELAGKLNSRLEETLTATAAVARDEEAWWSRRIERVLDRVAKPYRGGPDLVLPLASFRNFAPAVQRRVLRAALRRVRGHLRALDLAHVEAVRALIFSSAGHNRVQVPGADCLRSFEWLLLARPETLREARDYEIDLTPSSRIFLPFGQGSLCVEPAESGRQNCANVGKEELVLKEEVELDGDAVPFGVNGLPVRVRNWRPGDAIGLPLSSHPVKLKTLFQESRVALWERRHWPVLAVGDEIAWTSRFGVAARFAATAGSRRLRLVHYRSPEGSGEL